MQEINEQKKLMKQEKWSRRNQKGEPGFYPKKIMKKLNLQIK